MAAAQSGLGRRAGRCHRDGQGTSSSTATPGATYGLTFNGEPQGIERYGIDYVYVPGSGTIQNWVNMGRTRRADATNRVPLYSGGQTWTRDGNTFLLPFGNASNQNNTPGLMDNGATNGPTILYSTDLPADMYRRVIANSKFRLPGKRFTNMPDDVKKLGVNDLTAFYRRFYAPNNAVLIVAGDHIYKMDYGRMLAFHAKHQADMTVACIDVPIADAREFGVMGVDGAGQAGIEGMQGAQDFQRLLGVDHGRVHQAGLKGADVAGAVARA